MFCRGGIFVLIFSVVECVKIRKQYYENTAFALGMTWAFH